MDERFENSNYPKSKQKCYRPNHWLRTTIFARNGCRMQTLRNDFVPEPFFIDNDFFRKPFFLPTVATTVGRIEVPAKKIIANFSCLFLLCLFHTNLLAAVSISQLESFILVVKLKHDKIFETPNFFPVNLLSFRSRCKLKIEF